MQISLQNLIPTYLEESKIKSSEIWNKQLLFSQGERVQVVATSGRGKTSLMHMLYGQRRDYQGRISYDSQAVKDLDIEGLSFWRRQKISIVFQDLRLFLNQTVKENLVIKRQLEEYENAAEITVMAERLGIGSKLSKPAFTCSYGEQQRVAIIRALQQPFDFLLLDEPFSHLDDRNKLIAMELIEEEAAKRNAGILYADLKRTDFFAADKIYSL